MTFADWLRSTRDSIREHGISGLTDSLYELYLGVWRRAGAIFNYGTPIYEEDWEILIVLDACRSDLMAEVTNDYEFVSREHIDSVASTSAEWMEKNFRRAQYEEFVSQTAYVSGNPFTDEVLFRHECPECSEQRSRLKGEPCSVCGNEESPNRVSEHGFGSLEEVWQYAWDDELGTIPPDPITDRAIQTWRETSTDRMIIHYMQPHHPFVGSEIQTSLSPEGFGEMGRESVWELLRRGEVSREEVWRDYRANLQYVLDDVSRLLENVTADRVILTADHGNALGEFGLYGHYRNVPLSAMKRVPWCETTAENIRQEEFGGASVSTGEPNDVEQRLEDLGYI